MVRQKAHQSKLTNHRSATGHCVGFLVPGWPRLGSTKSLPVCLGIQADRLTNHRSTTGNCIMNL
ncbi:MAG: hypothetical protein V1775_19065 [Bacteroidota bacterium]